MPIVSISKIYADTIELAKELFRSGKIEFVQIEATIERIFKKLKEINEKEG